MTPSLVTSPPELTAANGVGSTVEIEAGAVGEEVYVIGSGRLDAVLATSG